MLLPERLKYLPPRERNGLVKRLVFAKDLAKAFDCEAAVDEFISSDKDAVRRSFLHSSSTSLTHLTLRKVPQS